jgi:hypothetical protein
MRVDRTRRFVASVPPRLLVMLALATACSNTSKPPTGIVVEVQSEYTLAELDAVVITVTGPTGSAVSPFVPKKFQLGMGAGKYELPASLELLPIGNGNGDVHVDVKGQLKEQLVVERSATLKFDPGHWHWLTLKLQKVCASMLSCQTGMTCLDGTCRGDTVMSTDLPPYPMMTSDGGAGTGGSDASGIGGVGIAGTGGAAGASGAGSGGGPAGASGTAGAGAAGASGGAGPAGDGGVRTDGGMGGASGGGGSGGGADAAVGDAGTSGGDGSADQNGGAGAGGSGAAGGADGAAGGTAGSDGSADKNGAAGDGGSDTSIDASGSTDGMSLPMCSSDVITKALAGQQASCTTIGDKCGAYICGGGPECSCTMGATSKVWVCGHC